MKFLTKIIKQKQEQTKEKTEQKKLNKTATSDVIQYALSAAGMGPAPRPDTTFKVTATQPADAL